MGDLSISLFGQLTIKRDNKLIGSQLPARVQELLVYLLLFQDRSHTREVLAELLWPKSSGKQGLKYIRHTLWQLQDGLGHDFLALNGPWVSIKPGVDISLDVVLFNEIVTALGNVSEVHFNGSCAERAEQALSLYKGALFDGCYRDWCIVERERYQHLLLHLLDKLMAYCEARGLYEAGLEYGAKALQFDMAHERIHRRLMRLHYQAGNRAAAIRQFNLCTAFLKKALDAQPSNRTIELFDRVSNCENIYPPEEDPATQMNIEEPSQLMYVLQNFHTTLCHMQTQLEEALDSLSQTSQGDS